MTRNQLEELLKFNGYKVSEQNIKTLSEGIDSGRIVIYNLDNIDDNVDDKYLLEEVMYNNGVLISEDSIATTLNRIANGTILFEAGAAKKPEPGTPEPKPAKDISAQAGQDAKDLLKRGANYVKSTLKHAAIGALAAGAAGTVPTAIIHSKNKSELNTADETLSKAKEAKVKTDAETDATTKATKDKIQKDYDDAIAKNNAKLAETEKYHNDLNAAEQEMNADADELEKLEKIEDKSSDAYHQAYHKAAKSREKYDTVKSRNVEKDTATAKLNHATEEGKINNQKTADDAAADAENSAKKNETQQKQDEAQKSRDESQSKVDASEKALKITVPTAVAGGAVTGAVVGAVREHNREKKEGLYTPKELRQKLGKGSSNGENETLDGKRYYWHEPEEGSNKPGYWSPKPVTK